MQSLDQNSLLLIKYQPDEILFINKHNKQTYRYLDSHSLNKQTLSHPYLLNGIPFQQGVLYPKQQSTLLKEIVRRSSTSNQQQFSEEEIVNTFQPLFECLSDLHEKGVVHGSIHPENILIIDDEIKLRDGNAPTQLTSQYYHQTKTKEDDIRALGLCLLNCILITSDKPDLSQKDTIVEKCFERFSRSFVIFLLIIVREDKKYYSLLPKLLEGTTVPDEYLRDSYERIRSQRDKKNKVKSEVQIPSIHFGVIKKFPIGNLKKVIHHENIQNKADNETKKSGQRISKVQEKQLANHELMTKKLNEQEKFLKDAYLRGAMSKAAILNLSNFGLDSQSKRWQKDRISPVLNNRHSSKKK